jgi:formylmethanofuran dehydrogenase subunit C
VIRLRLREANRVPLEAEVITPDRLGPLQAAEIERLPVYYGNKAHPLAEHFEVTVNSAGEAADGGPTVVVEGPTGRVKRLGEQMSCGRLVVAGDTGMHAGAEMTGGELIIEGNADDWTGAEMAGGLLWIKGRAGNRAGSTYRGSKVGMTGGVLVVGGDAGHEVGGYMRRGLVVVLGSAQDFAGARMVAGTVLVLGRAGLRAGAGLRRGTVVVAGGVPEVLPTFRETCVYRPGFLAVYARTLRARGLPVPEGVLEGRPFRRLGGDLAELGKGELLLGA